MNDRELALAAWLRAAMQAAGRGEPCPPPTESLARADELPPPTRPLPAFSDERFGAVFVATLCDPGDAVAREWVERVRRVVGLNRRDPLGAARARTPTHVEAYRLLARWAAVLAVATWREQDLAILDALLTALDAASHPLGRLAQLRASPFDRDLVRFARVVAEAQLLAVEAS